MAASTTVVTSAPNPSVFGQTVTFTATVASVPPGDFTPTGTVLFTVDGGSAVTVGLDASGQASITTSSLTVGPHTVTATYSGDANLDPSTGSTIQQVNAATTSTTLTVSPNPAVCGQSVTLTAAVETVPAGAVPTGTVTFIISDDGPALVANLDATGQASVTVDGGDVETGAHLVAAFYSGDPGFSPSNSALVPLTVNQATSTVTFTATPSTSVCGESVTLCAQVTVEEPGTCTPTGTVIFSVTGGPTLTAEVDATGQACVTTDQLPVGTDPVTVTYSGDTGVAGSSTTGTVVVNQGTSTTLVTVTPDPVPCDAEVTICAQVTVAAPSTCVPTGDVTFTISGGPTLTGTLDASGQACVTTGALGAGSYTVTATYEGNGDVAASTGTGTITVDQGISSTVVSVTPNPSVCGEVVTICAQVTVAAPSTCVPTGDVTFTISGGPTLTGTLDASGQACVTASAIPVGPHTVTATYPGNDDVQGSTGTAGLTVNQAASTTALTVSPNPSVCGEAVTLCAQVAVVPPGTCVPTGDVIFAISGGPTLTGTLDASGQACVTTTAIPVGSHVVTATYAGDTGVAGSSTTGTVLVNQGVSTTSVSVAPDPSVCGEAVTICAQVTVAGPSTCVPTGTVTFAISGGPTLTGTLDASGQACVTTTAVPVGSHTVTATYAGSTDIAGSSGTATINVNPAASTTTLTITPNPSVCGEAVTLCVQVTTVPPGTCVPTGDVIFAISGGPTLTGTLDASGQACVTTSAIPVGTHTVTATYAGGGGVAGSSATGSVTVGQAASTTALTITPNPSGCGAVVTLCAQVTTVPPGTCVPTGTVTFVISGGPTLTGTLDASGQACVTTGALGAGSYTVTATYEGNGDVAASTGTGIITVDQGISSTAVTVTPNPSVCGEAVTICAQVTVAAPSTCVPTGDVTFTISGGPTLTGTLDASGQACVTTSAIPVGPHTVTATYPGNDDVQGSTGTAGLTVNQAASTTALTITPNPSGCGAAVTLCAQVTTVPPGTCVPTGTVTFAISGGPTLTGTLDASGQACVTTSAIPVGSHVVTATYAGDTGVAGSSTTGTVLVNQGVSTTSVSVAPDPSVCGEAVTICAQVTVAGPSTCVPTGTVTFVISGGPTLTGTLDASGQACVTTSAIPVGSHTVTATYAGSTGVTGSSGTATINVNPAASTTTLTVTPVSPTCGEAVTLCAQVTTVPPGTCVPTGTVTFAISGGPTLTGTLNASGQACVTTSAIPVGTHTVTATYAGGGGVAGSSATGSVTGNQAASTTALTITPNPSVCSQSVELCAQVTTVPPGTCTPTGTVTFVVAGGPTLTDTVNIKGRACVTVTGLGVGPHTVTATYSGNTGVAASSATGTATVNSTPTTTTVTSSPNPSSPGQTVTFTATVAPVAPGTGTPTGTVTFVISGGPTLIGTLNASGQATVSTNTLTSGPHTVTATYSGDTCYSSSSGTLVQNVSTVNTTLTATPATIRLRFNGTLIIPTLSATLRDQFNNPLPGRTITFVANSLLGPISLGSAVTNASGTATRTNVTVPPTVLTASTYTASFAGAPGLSPASANASLTFQPTPILP
ncbi:Ig-like domain-containing protein [Streptomyces coffeae]|uniref:Ig-like domain repeat protein n=1 Tax=Streptomyces coffeae TaxID=621382 RepID=A0ABS1NE89_9ACTN|nr:Ig-like domain-containing protein [Streptomyces coffeae]MBL1098215.1 Ig-like domain repeat protein [Streptomyces coffeae]